MCGIAGIILKQPDGFNLHDKIVVMTDAISHRGPDGEGFLIATGDQIIPCHNKLQQVYKRQDLNYIPKTGITGTPVNSELAFGHRRLSIIDLSETGHQPMCYKT